MSKKQKKKPPTTPKSASQTERQALEEILTARSWDFEDLRRHVGLPAKELESELRHLQQSLKRRGKRVVFEEAQCLDCGFVFRGRELKHFHPPSRCPECKSEQIQGPYLSIS